MENLNRLGDDEGGTRLVAHLCGVGYIIATPSVCGCTAGTDRAGPWVRAVLHGAPRNVSGCLNGSSRSPRKSLVAKIAAGFSLPGEGRADHPRGGAAAQAVRVAMTKFSVIVPTYNERRNIGILYLLLREAFAHPSLAKDEFEVVVVDDNSPDGTADVVRALQKEYRDERLLLRPRAGKLGLGTAYIHGLAHATGDFVVIMDADLSHHPRAIPEFIAKQRATGCDVVTGTRYVPGGGVHGWDTRRKLTSRVANYLAHVLLNPGVSDLTGSFRLYRKDALEWMVRSVTGIRVPDGISCGVRRRAFASRKVRYRSWIGCTGRQTPGAEIIGYLKGLIRLFLTV